MGKTKKKKVNPRRQPRTEADVKRAEDKSITAAWAIFFTVMRDKEGYGVKRLHRVWDEISNLSDGVARGFVSVEDLERVLAEEAGIRLI